MTQDIQNQPIKGILFAVLSMSGVGYIDNFIQVIAAEAGLWQFHFCRALVICLTLVTLSLIFRWRMRPKNWRAVLWRSVFFATSMIAYFGAAGMIPLAQAAAGLFTGPIFVLLISAAFLGTRIGIWRILAVAIGFAGVVLILKPEQTGLTPLVVIPVLGGLLYALGGISTRQWCSGESTVTLLLGAFGGLGIFGACGLIWFGLFPASPELLAELPFFAKGWVTLTPTFIFWTLVQAFGSMIAVSLLTKGYQMTEASYVAVAEYWFLVAAAFWGFALWGQVPDMRAIFGILAIVLAGLIIVFRTKEPALHLAQAQQKRP